MEDLKKVKTYILVAVGAVVAFLAEMGFDVSGLCK